MIPVRTSSFSKNCKRSKNWLDVFVINHVFRISKYDSGLLDRVVHLFELNVVPRVAGLGQAMLDQAMLDQAMLDPVGLRACLRSLRVDPCRARRTGAR
jgi:hypothetical protein